MKKMYSIVIAGLILTGFMVTNLMAADTIGALGRIKPVGGIINLSGPTGDTIDSILVKTGDHSAKDTPLVTFASLRIAELDLAVAKVRLRQIDSVSQMAIKLKEREIVSLGESHSFAEKSLNRLLKAGKGSVSAQLLDERKLEASSAKSAHDIATIELKRLKVKHETDVKMATAELALAQEKIKHSTLYAPSNGTVLDILREKGERCSGAPIIRIANLTTMCVVAEVFQADMLNVKVGQKVSITSKSLPSSLRGTVSSVGRIIVDPAKTAKVVIILDKADIAAKLINLQVDVSIEASR